MIDSKNLEGSMPIPQNQCNIGGLCIGGCQGVAAQGMCVCVIRGVTSKRPLPPRISIVMWPNSD